MSVSPTAAGTGVPESDNVLAALDVAPAIVRDLDGTVRFWSTGAERLYGWPRGSALGRRSHELLATRFLQTLDEIHASLLAEGNWHGELRHTTQDGRTLFIASHWSLQRGADGAPHRVVEINNDISFQRPGLRAMRRLAAIVESSSDAIIGKDLAGTVTEWNQAAESLFGYSAAEIVGRPILVLFPVEREAEEASILTRIGRGEQIEYYETVRLHKDGTRVPVSVAASPIFDDDGAIIGASTIVRDLTERNDRERRLREAQSELFHVQRLTELGQLVSALVHEVNQPLAAIGNYAGAGKRLIATGQTGGARTALEKIIEQTDRAHQIIQRLRNFVRKGAGAQAPQHLQPVIAEAVALASVTLKQEPVLFETRLHPAAPAAVADRVQIQQVLFNLLRNAIEAMAESPRREVVISVRPGDAGMVEIAVADTGPGLSPEVQANLFRPFVTTKEHGMGVGLSICRSIIEMHGGRLWADDNPGGGTVFRFTLVRPEAAEPAGP